MVFVSLTGLSLTRHHTLQVHPWAAENFLLLRRIPLCERATAILSTHLLMGPGCLQILETGNNAATNTGCLYSFELVVGDS